MTQTQQDPQPSQGDQAPGTPEAVHSVGRRSLLKAVGVAGATVLVAGTGVAGYRTFDNGVLDAGSGRPYEAWTQWRTDPSLLGSVAAAILAANPHNTQPWTFKVTDTTVDVFSDIGRRMAKMDPLGREHYVGLGCALENLVLAADARGLRPSVIVLPTAGDPTHVARVSVVRATAGPSRLYDAIGDRHSNRGPYRSEPIDPASLTAYMAQVNNFPGVALRLFVSAEEKAALAALVVRATEAILADAEQSTEAFAWFRNNRDDIDTHRDGLTLDGQGLSPAILTLAKLLPASSRTTGDQFWLDQTRTVHTATAAVYGVITVADPADLGSRIAAGRVLQRIHLAATADGLGLQHLNQITERIDREQSQGLAPSFGPKFDALIGSPGQHGLVTFRLGHPERDGRRSPRRALADVTR